MIPTYPPQNEAIAAKRYPRIVKNEIAVQLQGKDISLSTNVSELIKQNCYSDKNVLTMILKNLFEHSITSIKTGSINITLSNPIPEFLLMKGIEVDPETAEKAYLMIDFVLKGVDSSYYASDVIFDPYVQVEKNSKKFLLQSLLLGSTKKYINKLKGEMWINNQYANQVSISFVIPIEKALVENV